MFSLPQNQRATQNGENSETQTEKIVRRGVWSLLNTLIWQLINFPQSATTEKEKTNVLVYQLGMAVGFLP